MRYGLIKRSVLFQLWVLFAICMSIIGFIDADIGVINSYASEDSITNGASYDIGNVVAYYDGMDTLTVRKKQGATSGSMGYIGGEESVPWRNIKESIKHIIIEDGVSTIGRYAFSNCTQLLDVKFNTISSVSLYEYCFNGCSSLSDIQFGSSSIWFEGDYIFNGCVNLTSIENIKVAWVRENSLAGSSVSSLKILSTPTYGDSLALSLNKLQNIKKLIINFQDYDTTEPYESFVSNFDSRFNIQEFKIILSCNHSILDGLECEYEFVPCANNVVLNNYDSYLESPAISLTINECEKCSGFIDKYINDSAIVMSSGSYVVNNDILHKIESNKFILSQKYEASRGSIKINSDTVNNIQFTVAYKPSFKVTGYDTYFKIDESIEYIKFEVQLDPAYTDIHVGSGTGSSTYNVYDEYCTIEYSGLYDATITVDTSLFIDQRYTGTLYIVSSNNDTGVIYRSSLFYPLYCDHKLLNADGIFDVSFDRMIVSLNKISSLSMFINRCSCDIKNVVTRDGGGNERDITYSVDSNGIITLKDIRLVSTGNKRIVVKFIDGSEQVLLLDVIYSGLTTRLYSNTMAKLTYDFNNKQNLMLNARYRSTSAGTSDERAEIYGIFIDGINITDKCYFYLNTLDVLIPDINCLDRLTNGEHTLLFISGTGECLSRIIDVKNSSIKNIVSISINNDVIINYDVNGMFNNIGTATVEYEDGSTDLIYIKDTIIKDFDTSTVGNSTVTLSYNNFDFNYEITVKKTLESISFSEVKQEYTIGDEVDKTGKYILHYSDGTTEEHDIPIDKFDGITTDAEKTYTLIIEQDGVSGQIEISVNRPNKVASSIAVTGVTKNYSIDDIFDGKGKIVISYTDGTSNEVELLESMISGFDTSEAGLVTVTVTYNGLTTTFDINVKEASGGVQPPTEETKPPVALTTLTYEFYKDYPDDVIIPLQMNDATDVTVVKVGSETLTENDYELVDSAIVLKKEFLENLEEAKHWVRLTFNDKANTVVSNIILQVYDELGSSEKPVLLYKRIVYDGNQFELPFVSGTGDYEAHDVDALIVDGTIYLPNGLEMPYSKSIVNEIALMRTYIEEDNDILYNDYEEDIIDEEDEYYETATPSNARRIATSSNAIKESGNTKKLTSRQQDIIDALTVDDSGRVFTVENDTIIVDNDWFESLGIEENNNYLLGAVFSNDDKTVDDKKVVISVPKGYDNSGSGDGEQKPPTGDGEQKPPTGDGSDGEQKPPTGGDEGTEKPPTGGDEGTEKPPTGGDEGTEKPPIGGDGSGTEKPPTGDGSETEKPPTGDGGNQGTTKPPTGEGDGGNQGTTKPPTGEGDGSTTKPPTGGGNGSTGNPPIDDGNNGTAKPPTGDGSTNPPSGGNNSGTNTDGNNGGQNSGSNTPNRRPSHSSGGSGGSSSSTSNKTPVNPTVNSDGSLNTGYRPSVPNNGGTFVLDENGNKVYKFPDGSIPLSTWIGDGKNWYYQNKDGLIETGWFLDNDGSWYMLCKEEGDNYGAMLCGWYFEIADGKWYFLNPADGRMLIGWQHINNKWYYLNERTDEQTYFGDNVNGWFYNSAARPFGSMWCNEVTPDGYKVDTTGAWVQ